MISHLTTAHRLKNGGFFFVLGTHHRGKLSLSSNEEVDLSLFLYIGVGQISFREINVNEFSS